DDEYTVPIGKAKVVEEGEDLTVVTWGATTIQCLEAIDSLPEDLSVELIDLRTISPYDADTICESVEKTGRCVVVHEAPKTCGMGAEIAAMVQERCFLHLEAPVQRVAGFDTIMPFYKLELDYLPDAKRVERAIMATVGY
ncbi:MAG: transketolase C-terminal domain-containing protein, partial [Planctomycetota bacterium]